MISISHMLGLFFRCRGNQVHLSEFALKDEVY